MAKYTTIFIIIALGLTSLLTFTLSKNASYLPSSSQASKQEQEEVKLEGHNFHEWHEYTAPSGVFKVLLPSLPNHAADTFQDPKTNEIRKYDMHIAEKDDGTTFMISLITFPNFPANTQIEKKMESMVNDMMSANSKNTLRRLEKGEFKGYKARDFSFGNEERIIDGKIFAVDNTFYILTRIANTNGYTPEEYKFFINSFTITAPQEPAQPLK